METDFFMEYVYIYPYTALVYFIVTILGHFTTKYSIKIHLADKFEGLCDFPFADIPLQINIQLKPWNKIQCM